MTHVLPCSLAGPGGAPAPYEFALATDAVTQLLASKDPADELLEEFFYNFPTIFTGLCFAPTAERSMASSVSRPSMTRPNTV